MYKLIDIVYLDQTLECMVEYVEIEEDNNIVKEITRVLLPDGDFDHNVVTYLTEQASAEFHNIY